MAEIAFAERCRRTIEDKSLKAEDWFTIPLAERLQEIEVV